jgi:hypothetical protein
MLGVGFTFAHLSPCSYLAGRTIEGSRLDPAHFPLNALDALPGPPYHAFPFQH